MKIRQKGNKFEIAYRIPGYKSAFYERYDSLTAAQLRIAEITYEKEKIGRASCRERV